MDRQPRIYTEAVLVRLTPGQKKLWERKAKAAKVSIAEMVRRAVELVAAP
jgi:hypothetical protein